MVNIIFNTHDYFREPLLLYVYETICWLHLYTFYREDERGEHLNKIFCFYAAVSVRDSLVQGTYFATGPIRCKKSLI